MEGINEVLEKKINNCLCEDNDFVLQLGQDALMELKDAAKVPPSYNDSTKDSPEMEPYLRVVAYCDVNGYKKKVYNEYKDKRVVAKSMVRMKPWFENLKIYKKDGDTNNLNSSAVKYALDYLLYPDINFPVVSEDHYKAISQSVLGKEYDPNSFVTDMKKKFEKQLEGVKDCNKTWVICQCLYERQVKGLWNKAFKKYAEQLDLNKNLILTGAPGTGKTYLTKQIAELMGAKDGTDQFKFVQFHPSYDYTDFVEGLRPTSATTSGSVGFERRDGVFKEFCKNALKELEESPYYTLLNSNSVDENGNLRNADAIVKNVRNAIDNLCKKLVYVEDEDSSEDTQEEDENIHDDNKIGNENKDVSIKDKIRSLPSDIKKEFNKVVEKVVSLKEKDNNSFDDALEACQSLLKYEPKYIFVIDEINRGEMSKIFGELFFSIDPGYRGTKGRVQTQYQNLIDQNGNDPFKGGFYVPENVYIIGTMNDIDRSVDSMDFAMRRRFVWMEVTAEESADNMLLPNESVERMSSLNEAIENVEGLDSSYHIGAAYFLKLEKCGTGVPNETNYELLWKYSIEGVVKEYLRGMADSDKTLKKLKKAYDLES